MIYWRGGDWLGIGPGAHGRICLDKTRIATTAPPLPKDWLEQVKTTARAVWMVKLSAKPTKPVSML